MKTSNAQCPFQALVLRSAENLKAALADLRLAESEVEFEIARLRLEQVLEDLELGGA